MILAGTPFPLPIHLGHECVGEVVEGPEGFTPGDRVIIPFQISCGNCERCGRGLTGNCETVPPPPQALLKPAITVKRPRCLLVIATSAWGD